MRKNVLIFCHGYATQFIDVNNQYTKLFDTNKYHVTVAYLVGEPNEAIKARHLAETVIFINSPQSSTRGLKIYAIKKMFALHKQNQFQIVICHRYKPTYIMLWVSRFLRVPVLFSVMHEFKTMRLLSRKLTVSALAPQNMIFAGVSNAVRDDLRRDIWKIPSEQIITLYNMLDIDVTEPELLDRETARKQLGLSATDFIFGTIGRLAIAKDQKTLIEAFAKIKPHCPRAKLVIIGDGELENDLKIQVTALGLNDDAILTGFIPLAFKYMKAFDVFTLPSIKEAFGRVLLEAMIAKVPIIASAVNGIPEVIDTVGTLIPPQNVIALAEAMLNHYQTSQEQLLERGEKCYQRTLQHFSLQRFNEIFWQQPFLIEQGLMA